MGNDEKRSQLLHAQGELKVGRREDTGERVEEEKRHRRMIYLRGLALGAVVVAVVVVLLMILGSNISIAGHQ